MKILYLMVLPALVIIAGLFLIVSEITKAIERSTIKLGIFYELKRGEDPVIAFSIFNQRLLENQSIFDLNFTNAQVNLKLCKEISAKMIQDVEINDENGFMESTDKYVKSRCAE